MKRNLLFFLLTAFVLCGVFAQDDPLPNYLIGKWQAEIQMPDGPVVCIIEFRDGGSAIIERYDTWEHRGNNALRYEGYGSGYYTYEGYSDKTITVDSAQVRIDAQINVNFRLEETLSDQTNISQSAMSIAFSNDKNSFEFASGSFPCGRNYDGPSVYPSAAIAFTNFVKIR